MSTNPNSESDWTLSPDDCRLIDRLSKSDDVVDQAYAEVYRNNCFVVELGETSSGKWLSGVGKMTNLLHIERQLGTEIDPLQLSMGDCIDIGTQPGLGISRAESILDGLRNVLGNGIESDKF